ncbi:methyltransferase domain-containing protein [Candidatus Berkiella aquae]|uniref:Class I SAM-dependent methyltransferase n=1 Tax=Candidatus Berkiella aquae TaxID=295108 RepID=A0A0Q9YMA8_9GAMM|nr:class I SAM-dependent methyltransferase [Candidatus Berkiella aquae]MCS5710425.1 class I SAM-dependent methyltransferase [Candidatus Berkiella aquae]
MANKTSPGSQSYALATGNDGAKRLSIQNNLLSPFSQDLLAKAGLAKGMQVFDIACGNGTMTSYLAKTVGSQGHVYAIDISQEQLNVAKEQIAAEKLTNVTFIHADIMDPQILPQNKANLIYARFLLMHLTEPVQAVQHMKSLLVSGGKVASEEATKNTTFSAYQTAHFADYIDSVIKLGASLGVDYNIGRRLYDIFQQAAFSNVEVYYQQKDMTIEEAKALFSHSLQELKNKLLQAKLATQDKINLWEQLFANIPLEDNSLLFRYAEQAYLIAQK